MKTYLHAVHVSTRSRRRSPLQARSHALIPLDVCELVDGLVHVRRLHLQALGALSTGSWVQPRCARTFSPARKVFSTVLPGARVARTFQISRPPQSARRACAGMRARACWATHP